MARLARRLMLRAAIVNEVARRFTDHFVERECPRIVAAFARRVIPRRKARAGKADGLGYRHWVG